MKIVIDIRTLQSNFPSGIPEYTKNLTKQILKTDKTNEYWFFINNFYKNLNDLPDFIPSHRLINFNIPNKILNISSKLFNFPQVDILTKADIFFSPHFNLVALNDPSKHIITIHDLSFIYFPEFFSFRKNVWHFFQGIKKQLKTAGKIIAVSNFTKQTIIDEYKIPEEKIKQIYPGVSEFYRPLPKTNEDLKKFQVKYKINFPFILNVATIEPRKNHLGLIEAFRLLKTKKTFKDYRLIIAGNFGWNYKKIVQKISQNNKNNDIILFRGANYDDLLFLYNLATLFVYPSFFEGFGFPPLEAQRSGLPVVASNRTSLPEILNQSAILIDPYKVYELASAMEFVLNHNQIKIKLIEDGKKNSLRFNWQTTALHTLKTIQNND